MTGGRPARCCCLLLLLLLSLLAQVTASTQDPELRRLVEDFWQWKLREFPEFATINDDHRYDDRLESYDFFHFDERKAQCDAFLRRARAMTTSSMSRTDIRTHTILTDHLDTYTRGYHWREFGPSNPLNFMEGFHKNFAWIRMAMYETREDFVKYKRRLESVPKQIEEITDLMRRAALNGKANHIVSMAGVVEEIEHMATTEADSTPYYFPYSFYLDMSSMPMDERSVIQSEGAAIIRERIQPAYERLKTFLINEYLPRARREAGVGAVDNGTEYYNEVLRWHLSESRSAQEVHELGESEVRRITQEMHKVVKWLGHGGNVSTYLNGIKNDSRFYEPTEERLLDRYKYTIYHLIQPRLPALFNSLSRIPNITVQSMSHDGIAAYYVENTMVVNTNRPHTRAVFDVMAISLHEALPGHHLQVATFKTLDIPNFQKYGIPGKTFSAPFRFPHYSAFIEGWALYAENLGLEMGLYEDAHDLLGKFCFELFRASRLVVDTGIHALGWSRSRAVNYMTRHSCLTDDMVNIEIDRYITWPGQACAYKIGELKLHKLRQSAQKRLDYLFDIREFHSQVIDLGPVPLRILEEHLLDWVNTKLAAHAGSGSGSLSKPACYYGTMVYTVVFLTCVRIFR